MDGYSTISLGSLFQYITTLSEKNFFSKIQPEPPLGRFKDIPYQAGLCSAPHTYWVQTPSPSVPIMEHDWLMDGLMVGLDDLSGVSNLKDSMIPR